MGGAIVMLLLGAILWFWLTPIFLIFRGLTNLKSNPEYAKRLLIIAAIMLVVGLGFCGVILS